MQKSKTILVIATHHYPIVLQGIASIFKDEPDIALVSQVTTGKEALQAVREQRPDIVLLKRRMPDMGALEAALELRKMGSKTSIVILGRELTSAEFLKAVQIGVRGIFLWQMPAALLVQCVRVVNHGGNFLEENIFLLELEQQLQRSVKPEKTADTLTARELAVVGLVVKGLGNKQVARKLDITEGTVKSHLHRSYEKLRVHNRLGLLQFARLNGSDGVAPARLSPRESVSTGED